MSRGFVKDGDQEEVPLVPERAFLPKGNINYVTPDGLAALEQEKVALLNERETAAGNEVDRRVTRNYLNAVLELLEERLKTAVVLEPKETPEDVVAFGRYVTLDMGPGRGTRVVRITGADQADAVHMISYFSPLAEALAGKRPGQVVSLALPAGLQEVTIVAVSTEPPHDGVPNRGGQHDGPRDGHQVAAGVKTRKKAAPTPKGEHPVVRAVGGRVDTGAVGDQSAPSPETPSPKIPDTEDLNEIFPLVNERGLIVGRAHRWQCHDGSKLLHPVVHLHLFDSQGRLYLQKRPSWKAIQPDKWDTAVGGHVAFGEKPEAALRREAREELGLEHFKPVFLKQYVFESAVEKELVYVFKTTYDGPVLPGSELDGGRFWTRAEIMAHMGKKIFTPNFEGEFKKMGF